MLFCLFILLIYCVFDIYNLQYQLHNQYFNFVRNICNLHVNIGNFFNFLTAIFFCFMNNIPIRTLSELQSYNASIKKEKDEWKNKATMLFNKNEELEKQVSYFIYYNVE